MYIKISLRREINLPSLKQKEFRCGSASKNDTLKSSSNQDMQVNKRDCMNAAPFNRTDQDYEKLHTYCNKEETYDVTIVD
ncbi:hypothetical protein CHS0354_021359 [Potamilus streckersoni]|uniref:Uncharacterized protein n=1 Tax=Potamilus streckersoni TaxID=2493646 RepID=A0AAE0S3Y9_9BIVA|nr:hypothetical protein CHS0354_021359 [Potamilus streckersoni]